MKAFPPSIPGITIEHELGRGAHSVVYRATRAGEPCALKLPRSRARWSKWIRREAVALARVRHDGLPRVLEVGEVDGFPYLAMELVRGATLAEHLATRVFDEAQTVELAYRLLAPLAAVHDAGLVHRDLKPRNVIIDITTNETKLVDFGFATPVERVAQDEVTGTVAYAAPEQLSTPGRVDARADLFALGRVLFECLVGAARSQKAALIHDARVELLALGVQPALADLVAGLLRPRPDDRYPDAHSVVHDLDLFSRGARVVGPAGYASARMRPRPSARRAELAELTMLGKRLLTSSADAGGELFVLAGPRGSGRTNLLACVASHLRDASISVVEGRARRDDPPYALTRRLVEELFRRAPDAAVDVVGNLAPVASLVAPGLASTFGPESAAIGTEALPEAVAELLNRLARGAGVNGIMIDDLQWVDHASYDAIERLAYRIHEVPLVLGLAVNDDALLSHVEQVRLIAAQRKALWELGSLTREQVADIIADHLGAPAEGPLVERIHLVAGTTPLGVREVLEVMLENGVLVPFDGDWRFDAGGAESVDLPKDIVTLLGRRLTDLPPATLRVLETAAVIGSSFEDLILAGVIGIAADDLDYATSAAIRAGVLVRASKGVHAFVHDRVRELLVGRIGESRLRALHRQVAEQMDGPASDTSTEHLFRLALHYAHAEDAGTRAYETAVQAATTALARFDNETALVFLEHARRAAAAAETTLPADYHRDVGEAQLRLGRLDESLGSFEQALALTRRPTARAVLLGRLAWVHQVRAEPARAWDELGRAFDALGARMPVESVVSAASTTWSFVRGRVTVSRERERERERMEALCALHYQNARLGLEYGKPLRLLQSSLEAFELSKSLPDGRVEVRAAALHGFVVAALRFRKHGLAEIAEAKRRSERMGDPATTAFCVQVQSTAACWLGELEDAITRARECIDVYGPWLELNEVLLNIANVVLIESVRGRTNEAWAWLQKMLERLRRSRSRTTLFDYVIHCARATMSSMERGPAGDAWLVLQLSAISPDNAGKGYHRLLSWGPRARFYVERGELGAPFENLIADFEREAFDPGSAHPVLIEYYIAVVHGRMHQCLRATTGDRRDRLVALQKAAHELRTASKALRLARAHSQLADGCLAWLEGAGAKATRLLTNAETIAVEQSAPWVLYGVARVRAHMLRESGRLDVARDHARVAEVLATEHGALNRARWIREEFSLSQTPKEVSLGHSSTHRSSSRTNRQLAALLQVARAPRLALRAEEQATAVLDELLQVLQGSRASLLFVPEPSSAPVSMARFDGKSLPVEDVLMKLLREVNSAAIPWPPEDNHAALDVLTAINVPDGVDVDRATAVPLCLFDRPVGAVAIQRAPNAPPFSMEDRSLLVLLSHQVSIALEIARLLFEREQLHASLQHAKKMEAMGALAGGLAHDFNNMLAAMRVALGAAQERTTQDSELSVELEIISQATTRAAQLTGQLLSFSRHQPVPVAVHEVNKLISTIEPMLRRVVGAKVNIVVNLSSAVNSVEVDQGSFDQALVNLLINARDAMPNGGKITVSTQNVVLAEGAAQRANVAPGEYVEIEIADTGQGMNAETMSRIFEPFYTTKAVGSGSGLGLSMVYAFARNCGGSIEVQSEIDAGTQFRLYLRHVDRARVPRSVRPLATIAPGTVLKNAERDTILVVDDDDLVRRSISKILERNGYRVLAANSSKEALRVVSEQGGRIGLVILDVLMPGTTGPELGRRLYDLKLPAKLLFVSGFAPESIPFEQAQVAADMLLQKPFSQSALLERVRQLMNKETN